MMSARKIRKCTQERIKKKNPSILRKNQGLPSERLEVQSIPSGRDKAGHFQSRRKGRLFRKNAGREWGGLALRRLKRSSYKGSSVR